MASAAQYGTFWQKRMPEPSTQPTQSDARPRYRWPWFVLAAVLLAVLLAVLWMSREIQRTRSQRQWNSAPAPTNPSPSRSPGG